MLEKVSALETWLAEKEEAQRTLTLFEMPAFNASEIAVKLVSVEKAYQRLNRKKATTNTDT